MNCQFLDHALLSRFLSAILRNYCFLHVNNVLALYLIVSKYVTLINEYIYYNYLLSNLGHLLVPNFLKGTIFKYWLILIKIYTVATQKQRFVIIFIFFYHY